MRRRVTSEERRKRIIDAAMRLFSKRGFRGTTTKEIAKKAGISEALIYRHFKRKKDLYTAIINERCCDASGSSLLLKSIEGKRGKDVFREVAEYLIRKNEDDPKFMRLFMFSALENHELSDIFFKSRIQEIIDHLSSYIKDMIDSGVFRGIDPSIASRAFLGMVINYVMTQEVFGGKKYKTFQREDVVEAVVAIFYDGMERRDG